MCYRSRTSPFVFILAGLLTVPAGCGPGGPKTYPVQGKISYKGGDVKQLLNYQVQLESEPDGKQKAVGEIDEDGAFSLLSNVEGQGRAGVPEGTYRARLLPPTDRENGAREARKLLHPRYLSFSTSGLTVAVPTSGAVVLDVEKPAR